MQTFWVTKGTSLVSHMHVYKMLDIQRGHVVLLCTQRGHVVVDTRSICMLVIGSLCSGDTPPIMHEIGKGTGTQESVVF